ncbi:MAG TPA: hypothetical protein VF219_02855 [Vicinamibacterales bacterium]
MLPVSVSALERDLRDVFGARLLSLVAYGLNAHHHPASDDHGPHPASEPVRTMAIVESLTEGDLRGCASRVRSWHEGGLATPLIVPAHEFERSLDVFPLEFAAIAADHVVAAGTDLFSRSVVENADVRRACEVQARSHLLHLREGLVEAGGNSDALAVLIVDSARPLAALLISLARLEGRGQLDTVGAGRHAERILALAGGVITDVVALTRVHEITAAEAERIFPAYLAAMERLVEYVDRWQQ